MVTTTDPFTVQFDFGKDDVTEETASFAEVWDGPIQVANLIRRGDAWIVDHLDTDYADPHHVEEEYETVADVVKFIQNEVNA